MRVPQLRRHASGQFMVRYGGQDHYLGHDKREAESAYLRHLDTWRNWREEERAMRERDRGRGRMLVMAVADLFLADRRRELGADGAYWYEKSLRPFLMLYGAQSIDWLQPSHLNNLKSQLISERKAPKTINHTLNSVRSFMRWAGAMGFVKRPADFTVIRNVPLGPVNARHATVGQVRDAIISAQEHLRPWMAIQYLALMRPSEVLRVVNREGEFVDRGVFVLSKGKMDRKVSMKRHILLSDEALGWLDVAEPRRYTTLAGYSSAVRGYEKRGKRIWGPFEPGPKVIQKSAAQHLVMRGATDSDIDLLLGHYKGRLSFTYFSRHWQRLRAVAAMNGLGPASTELPSLQGHELSA